MLLASFPVSLISRMCSRVLGFCCLRQNQVIRQVQTRTGTVHFILAGSAGPDNVEQQITTRELYGIGIQKGKEKHENRSEYQSCRMA